MINFLVVGVVGVVATLLGNYAVALWAAPKEPAKKEEFAVEAAKLEPLSVPVVRNGAVQGYVIARVTIMATATELKGGRSAILTYASEAVLRAIYEEEKFDFNAMTPVQLGHLANRITKLANERMGRPSIKQSAIEGLSFVARSDTRTGNGR